MGGQALLRYLTLHTRLTSWTKSGKCTRLCCRLHSSQVLILHKLTEKTIEAVQRAHLRWHSVVATVHDEAANMVAAGRLLNEEIGWVSETCAAHRLQAAISHAINDVNAVDDLLSRARKLVGHFQHSAKAKEALTERQKQLNLKQLKLK